MYSAVKLLMFSPFDMDSASCLLTCLWLAWLTGRRSNSSQLNGAYCCVRSVGACILGQEQKSDDDDEL